MNTLGNALQQIKNLPVDDTRDVSKERRFLSPDEQKRFLQQIENNWYKEMFYIMFLTGMRVGDDHVIIRLKLDKPSKYKGLS